MANYEFEYAVETSASPEAVWQLWSDVSCWPEWDGSVQRVELDGPFAAGATGTMHLDDRPPLPFRCTVVEPARRFVDETEIPGALLRFDHLLEPLADGRTRITHRVEIEAPQPMADELGPMVTSDVPEAVRALAALAEARCAV